ncbi:oxamate carbamoyltransferase subunit AllG family protein [Mycolicibacterium baixiangningiae]|uniref:oxamate carbamoyltransferase subunit AllG family protein n=1 Tax=Mycolicibacterium baixiangningiae TaxID=2761578 RepID=UPI0018675FF1|nr:DUF1116 domain-containing protein [Mycolicibacterium baixiangningiae]
MTQDANSVALQHIVATDPVWTGIARAADVVTGDRVLFHAGPPFRGWDTVPVPVRNSLALATVYEGWATTPDDALTALANGDIGYRPAQDHDMVVPLCGVISPSMALHVIADSHSGRVKYAALNEGMAHCLRLGIDDREIPAFHRWLNGNYADYLARRVGTPVRLLPFVAQSHALGDDGHSRTLAASGLFRDLLVDRDTPRDIAEFLATCGAFALNLWMGAAALILAAPEGIQGCDLVTRAGGNGTEFGIQIASHPGRWVTTAATPPQGPVEADAPTTEILGAIGDSAVVDVLGLGGQSLDHAPAVREALGAHLPSDALARPEKLLPVTLEAAGGLRTGLSARAVADIGIGPIVLLGLIAAGGHGRIGGGVYQPPIALFDAALGT